MGFSVIDRQPGGCSGKLSIGLTGEAVEIWTVVANNYLYSTEDLRNAGLFPEAYTTFHAQNGRLRMQPVDIQQDKDDPSLFICTLTWSSEKFNPEKEDEKEDSPLDRTAKISIETTLVGETTHRDFYGKPKVDAAGSLFDPPIENKVAILILKIRKNVTIFPDWVFNFTDAVNSVPFTITTTINGVPYSRLVDKGCAWMAPMKLGEPNTDGPVAYCESACEIWIKKRRKPASGESPSAVPDPWVTEQLNEGLFALDDASLRVRIKVKDDDGNMVFAPAPVPLTAAGKVLSPVTLDNLTFQKFRDHEELDFNALSGILWD